MYCSQCGNEIIENARFCNNCGHPIPQKEESNSAGNQQAFLDAVEDIQQKLREIDNRKKDPIKKENVIKSAIKVAKKGVSAIDSVFNNSFEEKKLADKKQLILNYPLPSSPKALANFAKYINSVIVSKKREPDALTDAWKDKLKQIYLFAETKLSTSQEFMEIQKYYNDNKRREKRLAIRSSIGVYIMILLWIILITFASSLAYQLPLLMFISILILGWGIIFILYIYDFLDGMIASIKQHSTKRKEIPKILRVIAWHLLIPALAALIVAKVYQLVFFPYAAVLLGVDALFLLFFLVDAYDL